MINVTLRPNPIKPLAYEAQSGYCGFITWTRLQQILIDEGVLNKDEIAKGFEIDTDGIKILIGHETDKWE